MTELDDKDVFVTEGKTKEVPCGECGRLCVVTLFATSAKVRCFQHHHRHGRKPGRRKPGASIRDPFEPGVPFDERVERLQGRKVILKRELAGIAFTEELEPGYIDKHRHVDGLREFREHTGLVHVICEHGGSRWFNVSEVEAVK